MNEALFTKATITVATVIITGVMIWIGINASHIPVIEAEITQIKLNVSDQVGTNVKRLDDHEMRLRELERKK